MLAAPEADRAKQNILLCLPSMADYWPVIRVFPPAGIAYVSAWLKKTGFTVHTLNLNLTEPSGAFAAMDAAMREHAISVVGVGGMASDYRAVKRLTDMAKQIRPDCVTLIGGGLVTFSPEEAMTLIPSADYGVIGEGEYTTAALLDVLRRGGDIASVHGVILRAPDSAGLIRTPPRRETPHPDDLPWPDYESFGLFDQTGGTDYGAVATSRSCPYACTFCAHSGGTVYRQRSLDSIFAEIDFGVSRYGLRELSLSDELFAADSQRILDFCERIAPYRLRFRLFLRIDEALSLPVLRRMKDAGCKLIYFGIESADNRILASMRKQITIQQAERVLTDAQKAGIHTMGGFIFGDVQETMETARHTIQWVFEHRDILNMASLEPIILYPGSRLYQDAVQTGVIADTTDFIRRGCPPTNVSRMSDEAYRRLIGEILPRANQRLRAYDVARYRQTGCQNWMI